MKNEGYFEIAVSRPDWHKGCRFHKTKTTFGYDDYIAERNSRASNAKEDV